MKLATIFLFSLLLTACGGGSAPKTQPSSAPQTLYIGDSIIAWSGWQVNAGIALQKCADIRARFQQELDSHSGITKVVLLCGTNDVLNNHYDVNADITAMVNIAKSRNLPIAICTEPPITFDVLWYGEQRAQNIITLGASLNVKVADFYHPMLGHPEYLKADGIHPSVAGYTVMRQVLAQ